jgi:hypothetical protein
MSINHVLALSSVLTEVQLDQIKALNQADRRILYSALETLFGNQTISKAIPEDIVRVCRLLQAPSKQSCCYIPALTSAVKGVMNSCGQRISSEVLFQKIRHDLPQLDKKHQEVQKQLDAGLEASRQSKECDALITSIKENAIIHGNPTTAKIIFLPFVDKDPALNQVGQNVFNYLQTYYPPKGFASTTILFDTLHPKIKFDPKQSNTNLARWCNINERMSVVTETVMEMQRLEIIMKLCQNNIETLEQEMKRKSDLMQKDGKLLSGQKTDPELYVNLLNEKKLLRIIEGEFANLLLKMCNDSIRDCLDMVKTAKKAAEHAERVIVIARTLFVKVVDINGDIAIKFDVRDHFKEGEYAMVLPTKEGNSPVEIPEVDKESKEEVHGQERQKTVIFHGMDLD